MEGVLEGSPSLECWGGCRIEVETDGWLATEFWWGGLLRVGFDEQTWLFTDEWVEADPGEPVQTVSLDAELHDGTALAPWELPVTRVCRDW